MALPRPDNHKKSPPSHLLGGDFLFRHSIIFTSSFVYCYFVIHSLQVFLHTLVVLLHDVKHVGLKIGAGLLVERVGHFIEGLCDGAGNGSFRVGVATRHDGIADGTFKAVAL